MPTVAEINNQLYRPIHSGSEYDAYMPYSDCSSVSLGSGTTDFGIKEMAKWVKKYKHHTKKLAPKLKRNSLLKTCENIKDFSYWNFQYKLDGATQKLRSPACSWASRKTGIDCKSYSIFVSSVLLNLDIPHYLRRIKQPGNYPDAYTHVYVVVPKDGKNLNKGYYTIDGTIQPFSEVSFLAHDDVFISVDSQGLGCTCTCVNTKNTQIQPYSVTPINVSSKHQAWATAMRVIQRFEELYPQNYDLKRFKNDLVFLKTNQKPVRLKIDGFTIFLNEKSYNLVPPQAMASPIYVGSDIISEYTRYNIEKTIAEVEMRSNLIKQQTAAVIQAVGQTSSSIATTVSLAFPPVAPVAMIVAAVIDVVTLLASLWAMFGYDPCQDAEYTAEDIGKSLQNDFVSQFRFCVSDIEKSITNQTVAGVGLSINKLLKEIDLGVAHYNYEKLHHDGNDCSKQALASFAEFVQNIKSTVDNLYYTIKTMLKGHFNFVETEIEAYTTERSWYFIVPTIKSPIRAKYRSVRIDKWNENRRAVYPYGEPMAFLQWAELNKSYLNRIYRDNRGSQYFSEISPFSSKIKEIRDNIYLPASYRLEQEEQLRKQMLPIYLKYDTDYKKSLEKSFQDEVNLINQRQDDFIRELKLIAEQRIETELRHKSDVQIIANSKNKHKIEKQKQQLISAGIIASICFMVIKSIN